LTKYAEVRFLDHITLKETVFKFMAIGITKGILWNLHA